jgi:phage tail sheath protein FI
MINPFHILDATHELVENSVSSQIAWNFELNNDATRARVVRNVSSVLRGHWRNGLLVGKKEQEAYFVICSAEDNNDPVVQASRKLKVRIGVAVAHASEFVDITIEQDTRALDAALSRGI